MIIEKSIVEGNRSDVNPKDYVAEGEITVTITLSEYRDLIEKSVQNKQMKEHESWLEQYQRANDAEKRVADLETEVSNLYKRLAEISNTDKENADETDDDR